MWNFRTGLDGLRSSGVGRNNGTGSPPIGAVLAVSRKDECGHYSSPPGERGYFGRRMRCRSVHLPDLDVSARLRVKGSAIERALVGRKF
jgi:hypothetical protein